MVSINQELRSAVPDPRNLRPDQLTVLGDSVLANSLALYHQRQEENGELICAFDSKIEV